MQAAHLLPCHFDEFDILLEQVIDERREVHALGLDFDLRSPEKFVVFSGDGLYFAVESRGVRALGKEETDSLG